MRLLITGANCPLGQWLCDALAPENDIQTLSRDACDHRNEENVDEICKNIDAILHCDVFDDKQDISEQDRLDWAARGTYVLLKAARKAGVERVILASQLSLFEGYPSHYVIDETWQPKPKAQANAFAPYMAELTCREFAREGGICCMALRFGILETEDGTSKDDALTAFRGALKFKFEPQGYRWHIFHVSSGKRFLMRSAQKALGFDGEGA